MKISTSIARDSLKQTQYQKAINKRISPSIAEDKLELKQKIRNYTKIPESTARIDYPQAFAKLAQQAENSYNYGSLADFYRLGKNDLALYEVVDYGENTIFTLTVVCEESGLKTEIIEVK